MKFKEKLFAHTCKECGRDMNKALCNRTEGENNLFCEFSNPLNIPLFILKNKLYTSSVHTHPET